MFICILLLKYLKLILLLEMWKCFVDLIGYRNFLYVFYFILELLNNICIVYIKI